MPSTRILVNLDRISSVMRHPLASISRVRFRRSGYRWLKGSPWSLANLNSYQPLFGLHKSELHQVRPMAERWQMLESHLPTGGSAMDVGCMNGYFTFKLAERGFLALGLDQSIPEIQTARLLSVWNRDLPASFAPLTLTLDSVRRLPNVDVVMLLSVFHHLVFRDGPNVAEQILAELCQKATKTFVFETGQPNEVEMPWAAELAFMGEDPESWIRSKLLSLGFSHVSLVGRSSGYMNSVQRAMFVAHREFNGK